MGVLQWTSKRWKVFCARCGHSAKFTGDNGELSRHIDKPCAFCGLIGVDAVEIS